ncbi:hypothetical protein [Streptomyces sp. NPDC057939]|uniref:hypothetical protein n=1 Tax=Streptomyces sp. NPDC057939 TaxID=3346284 RepID=UPI0036EF5E1D
MATLGSVFGTGDPSRASAVLIADADHVAPVVRSAAVAALGSSYGERVTAVLVARAGDVGAGIRHWSAWSLARRPASTARAAPDRLTTGTDADVRDAALKAPALPTRSS